MGMIHITTTGSFKPSHQESFSAMHGGHAEAVAEAIEFLSSVVLPEAIRLDHKLHAEGEAPSVGFGRRKDARSDVQQPGTQ
jgi:hypothetical protein